MKLGMRSRLTHAEEGLELTEVGKFTGEELQS